MAELLLERALDEVLGPGDELRAAGFEDEGEEPAPELRPHHPLAGGGEEHLLDQVAHVVVGPGRRRPAAAVHAVGKVDAHVASTRGCALIGSIGVPVGMHVEAPIMVASGVPPATTRTAPLSHWPVTQGGVSVPVSAQPATAYGEAIVTAGWPERRTRGKGASGCAEPACEHMTTAPTWRAGAGTYTTVSAPALMSTVGPSMLMTAPLPFEMTIPTSL